MQPSEPKMKYTDRDFTCPNKKCGLVMILNPEEVANKTFCCPYCYASGSLTQCETNTAISGNPDILPEEADPLDELMASVTSEAAESIDKLAAKSDDDADMFMSEARNLNPGAISRRSIRVLDDIERFIRSNIDEILSPEGELQDWSRIAHPLLPSGWLRLGVMHELMDLEQTLRDVRGAALEYGRFWQGNAGIGGFVKRAIGGYLNPLDGWLSFVGKNSVQTEQTFYVGELADAFGELRNAIETLQEDIITKLRLKMSEITSNAAPRAENLASVS